MFQLGTHKESLVSIWTMHCISSICQSSSHTLDNWLGRPCMCLRSYSCQGMRIWRILWLQKDYLGCTCYTMRCHNKRDIPLRRAGRMSMLHFKRIHSRLDTHTLLCLDQADSFHSILCSHSLYCHKFCNSGQNRTNIGCYLCRRISWGHSNKHFSQSSFFRARIVDMCFRLWGYRGVYLCKMCTCQPDQCMLHS